MAVVSQDRFHCIQDSLFTGEMLLTETMLYIPAPRVNSQTPRAAEPGQNGHSRGGRGLHQTGGHPAKLSQGQHSAGAEKPGQSADTVRQGPDSTAVKSGFEKFTNCQCNGARVVRNTEVYV